MKRVLSIITFIMFVISFIRIVLYVNNSFKNKKITNITSKYIIPVRESEYLVNFDILKSMNSDTTCYLIINSIDLKYVVLKAKDNKYYLNHNFNKEYSGSGWIFMDYRNKLDGSDKNIVIYGHNMKDNSMFGNLSLLLKSTYKDSLITLIKEDGVHKYKIVSSYVIDSEEYYNTVYFESDEKFSLFLDVIKYRSNIDYKLDLNTNDNILTLSTCYRDTNKRTVIHLKEIVD